MDNEIEKKLCNKLCDLVFAAGLSPEEFDSESAQNPHSLAIKTINK